jgi:hypothetical protein
MIMGMVVAQEAWDKFREEASKHSSFETFLQEITRLAESVWHQARGAGETQDPNAPAGEETTEAPVQPVENPQPEQAPSGEAPPAEQVTPVVPPETVQPL